MSRQRPYRPRHSPGSLGPRPHGAGRATFAAGLALAVPVSILAVAGPASAAPVTTTTAAGPTTSAGGTTTTVGSTAVSTSTSSSSTSSSTSTSGTTPAATSTTTGATSTTTGATSTTAAVPTTAAAPVPTTAAVPKTKAVPATKAKAGGAATASPPAIATAQLPAATTGRAYSVTLGVQGGTAPYTWSVVSGSLPAGLALAPRTGVISGQPTSAGTDIFRIDVTDSGSPARSSAQSLSLSVVPAATPAPSTNRATPSTSPATPSTQPPATAVSPTTTAPAGASQPSPASAASTLAADGRGYWVVGADGGVLTFGNAGFFGSAATPGPGQSATSQATTSQATTSQGATTQPPVKLTGPVVALTPTPDAQGYWLTTSTGQVLGFGDAHPYGSATSLPLAAPIVGMVATPDGKGYWLVGADGGVLSFGDATFFGSAPAARPGHPPTKLTGRVVGLTPTADAQGYWLTTSTGQVLSFGDAHPYGSATSLPLAAPIVGMVATPDGKGYWLVGADGGVLSFGDAVFFGSAATPAPGQAATTQAATSQATTTQATTTQPLTKLSGPVVGLTPTPDAQGYWLTTSTGQVIGFGDAHPYGNATSLPLAAPIVGMAVAASSPVATIPLPYLALDHAAAATCSGLSWSVLAGIGKVESDFGRSTLPGVGSGTNFAGAAGPMQIGITGAAGPTFPAYDQPTLTDPAPTPASAGGLPLNPWNPTDAVYTAARDLCANGGGNPATVANAILAYNHSAAYLTEVEALAAFYSGRGTSGRAVQLAMSQVDTPYIWGGTTPGVGFDCSGLVQWVYGQLGVTLPRTSQAQWAALPHLPTNAPLTPGDLVFFGPASGPTHVGLYAGNGLMIDAPNPGAVVRVEPYHWAGYLGATAP